MADSRDSEHSLLPADDELITERPSRSWHPLGRSSRSSPESEYTAVDRHESFSEGVFREVGLGISQPSEPAETLARGKRDSYLSSGTSQPSQPNTPGIVQTPAGTPGISQTNLGHLPNCPTRDNLFQRRLSWISITILLLAFYATCGAGAYLIIAFWKPRWSNISSDGGTVPSTANLLCAFFAKTIELAYVTICVAFLGQVLSRRALTQDSRGISLADMSMRSWIMQPGSMIVHWEALRYSALTFLGMIALVASFVAMLYTTAAEALVSPKLTLGPLQDLQLYGKVSASFGNVAYIENTCQTPLTVEMDPTNRNLTCFDLEHVGSAYHNTQQWMSNWGGRVETNNATSDKLENRPPPTGSIWDNTTVTGSWIEIQDLTDLSKKHKRFVQNVTMAFPHGNIPGAAMDSINRIHQPVEGGSGEGQYDIEAAVPSPALNVLCAGMTADELAPIVYTRWPNSSDFNATTWSVSPSPNVPSNTTWYNSTVVDDIFGFGEKYGQQPPIFGTYPIAYNTIMNTTGRNPVNAIYMLGNPNVTSMDYVMCSIRAKETGKCSTLYNAASSGAFLSTKCEGKSKKYQYDTTVKNFYEGIWSADFKNIVGEWASSMSLGSGITGADASIERLVMQMMPSHDDATDTYSLNPKLPSIGETLAVMAGSTLILSTQHSPFVQGWNYSGAGDMLDEPTYQHFSASLRAMGYASGGTAKWQAVFYVILIFAFITSAIVFVFLIFEARGHQITDFTEPQNLFAIAINSPQTTRLDGACGCGPVGRQLKERWFIGMEEEDSHYYIRAKADKNNPYGMATGGQTSGYSRFEVEEPGLKANSPYAKEFRRVSRRSSWLGKFY